MGLAAGEGGAQVEKMSIQDGGGNSSCHQKIITPVASSVPGISYAGPGIKITGSDPVSGPRSSASGSGK